MGLSYQLVEQLTLLEAHAAQCAALLDGAPPEVVEQAMAAFAPLPGLKHSTPKSREAWARTWLGWIAECGDRYEQRPPEPSADDLHRLLIQWVRDS